LWAMLGARGVDMLVWESFGAGWAQDARDHLGIRDLRILDAEYGALPALSAADPDRDIVFVWNGTTSGVCAPDGNWIAPDRRGLAICDATSAVFGMALPWDRLDVVTWSWQKAIGGEGAHGMLALGPRAVERLLTYTPPRPLPKIFRLTRNGALIDGVFRGETLNTPSMLCVEDALDALAWVESVGGAAGTIARTQANASALDEWVSRTGWIDYLARDPAARCDCPCSMSATALSRTAACASDHWLIHRMWMVWTARRDRRSPGSASGLWMRCVMRRILVMPTWIKPWTGLMTSGLNWAC